MVHTVIVSSIFCGAFAAKPLVKLLASPSIEVTVAAASVRSQSATHRQNDAYGAGCIDWQNLNGVPYLSNLYSCVMVPPAFRISSIARVITSSEVSLGNVMMIAFWISTACMPCAMASTAVATDRKRIVSTIGDDAMDNFVRSMSWSGCTEVLLKADCDSTRTRIKPVLCS